MSVRKIFADSVNREAFKDAPDTPIHEIVTSVQYGENDPMPRQPVDNCDYLEYRFGD